MKYYITILIVLVLGIGAIGFLSGWFDQQTNVQTATSTPATATPDSLLPDEDTDTATTTNAEDSQSDDNVEVIGNSADGRQIQAYHFGNGDDEILFVAGIHGGYEWNTAKLAYRMVDWFRTNSNAIPDNLEVTVIPVLNPDGLHSIVGTSTGNFTQTDVPGRGETIPGRFNANGVDLNRNFACNWQPQGTWQDRQVDAGSSAFSEPESQALRDYVRANTPTAAVVYYSAAGGVYTSSCNSDPLAQTTSMMNTYANASGYPAAGEFDAYEINGDAVDWMATQNIPGISVLLSNHTDVEWSKNKAGMQSILQQFAQ